jgi:hypothetical protein
MSKVFKVWPVLQSWILLNQRLVSQPMWARPRNLTVSDGRLRKDKKQTCRKLGSGGLGAQVETHNNSTTSSEFIIYSGKPGSRATVLRLCDIVVIRNRRNLRLLLSTCKHLRKSSCAAFCPPPFCSWGLCLSQPADYWA